MGTWADLPGLGLGLDPGLPGPKPPLEMWRVDRPDQEGKWWCPAQHIMSSGPRSGVGLGLDVGLGWQARSEGKMVMPSPHDIKIRARHI